MVLLITAQNLWGSLGNRVYDYFSEVVIFTFDMLHGDLRIALGIDCLQLLVHRTYCKLASVRLEISTLIT